MDGGSTNPMLVDARKPPRSVIEFANRCIKCTVILEIDGSKPSSNGGSQWISRIISNIIRYGCVTSLAEGWLGTGDGGEKRRG